jgi:hypothetical protein
MSNISDDYDDEASDQAKDPVRSRMKKLERDIQERDKQLAEATAAQRELAFLKAGVPADDPMTKYFVKGYDGEISQMLFEQRLRKLVLLQRRRRMMLEHKPSSKPGTVYKKRHVLVRQVNLQSTGIAKSIRLVIRKK